LSLEAKENYDNPECGEQSFSGKQRKFFRLYFGENGAVYPKFRRFIFAVG
jgi:hypothetical protein